MRALRPAMLVLLVAYCGLLAAVLFSPTAEQQSNVVYALSDRLTSLGAPPAWSSYTRLEELLNVVIIAPVTFLASGVARSLSWRDWTAFAFVAAVTVELVQGLVFPERQASFSDVVANTGGALCGAVLFWALVGWWLDRLGRDPRGDAERRRETERSVGQARED